MTANWFGRVLVRGLGDNGSQRLRQPGDEGRGGQMDSRQAPTTRFVQMSSLGFWSALKTGRARSKASWVSLPKEIQVGGLDRGQHGG